MRARNLIIIISAGIALLLCLRLAGRWMDYREEGGPEPGLISYYERGSCFVNPFTLRLHKITIYERTERKLKIENDFEHYVPRPPLRYYKRTAEPRLEVGSYSSSAESGSACGWGIAGEYESSQEFRSALKEAVRKGGITKEDVGNAAFDDLSPAVRKIRSLLIQDMKSEQGAPADSRRGL